MTSLIWLAALVNPALSAKNLLGSDTRMDNIMPPGPTAPSTASDAIAAPASTPQARVTEHLQAIWQTSLEVSADVIQILDILRQLERLHEDIRDHIFQAALPDNRQALYTLVKDMESKGGWPYIYRTRLIELLSNLSQTDLALVTTPPEERPSALPSTTDTDLRG